MLLVSSPGLISDSDAVPFLRTVIKDARATGMSELAAAAFRELIRRVELMVQPDLDWLAQLNVSLAMTLTTGNLPGAEAPLANAIEIAKQRPSALSDELVVRLAKTYADLLSLEGRDLEAEQVLLWSLNRGSEEAPAAGEPAPTEERSASADADQVGADEAVDGAAGGYEAEGPADSVSAEAHFEPKEDTA